MAEKDGKLYIVITDEPVINKTETIHMTESQKEKTIQRVTEEREKQIYTFATHQFYNFMQQTATEMVNWSISNIGNFTGNYVKQENIQKTVNLGSKLIGIGSAVVAGAQMAGPIGALVAGTIAVAGTGINIALQDRANEFQTQRQNREIAQLRELSGLNPLTNGGRI